ncbi:Syntaxin domain-containing protein/SNARE domain-containing protein [Cephalotus follicularis]|uniref:Syntaxin domain-containing protein/SNARE domain-containing protein n=1 Tax=Cephalotus follicularis TaxID=3775 RepID=A0A1Q3AM00_CEPFO|nr:Syntaxin domain-containing protein/SNARE domain-containing protein [Cephalotus follicularis]
MANTCRDRTVEFRSLTHTLKKIGGIPAVNQTRNDDPALFKPPAPGASGSEFNKMASRIGSGIHETSQKIARLAKLAKKSSIFNDPIVEIQELTALIKNDITALNMALSDLQTLQNLEIADGNYSEDRVDHSTTVCDDLKSKLMGTTKELQDVLTTRTENIKAHENRKQMFSTNVLRDSPLRQQVKAVTEPPPWSTSSNASGNLQPSALPPNGVQVVNQLRRRLAVDSNPSQHMEMSLLQQVVPRQENYTQSRAVALHNVESTITELSGIFTHLATMVAQQGELAIRIDDNMDESLANVEGARNSLLRHLNQISSNRWLLIKIFAIIMFFLMVGIFFVA